MSRYGCCWLKTYKTSLRAVTSALAVTLLLALVVAVMPAAAHAQILAGLHYFTGGRDGGTPEAGVSSDQFGNLYGTTYSYGADGYGAVYQLKFNRQGGFTFNPLYSFTGGRDGANPRARVSIGPDGLLYGTTENGGNGYGVVFKLQPPPTICRSVLCYWRETVLYAFNGPSTDGAYPGLGDLVFDSVGNIYGTTYNGGTNNQGTVYELTPSGSGYTKKILYSFGGGSDGVNPYSGVIFDNAGNLYGTTYGGGTNGYGTVYQLIPSDLGWTEMLLQSFSFGNGALPVGGLTFDPSFTDLYGAGTYPSGTVFELTNEGNDNWEYTLLYGFTFTSYSCGPYATLTLNGGNLYGTTYCEGAHGAGSVFELSPAGPPWILTDLYDFTGGSDGGYPISNVTFDVNNNQIIYGTASMGGLQGVGDAWQITLP